MSNNRISLNDVKTQTDPVSGRVTYKYELSPGATIEAKSIVELVLRIKQHYNNEEFDHGQAD